LCLQRGLLRFNEQGHEQDARASARGMDVMGNTIIKSSITQGKQQLNITTKRGN
jgi:hypothetical protein